ncbi:MAG: DUF2059 domain-containing protein [Bacteroidota bacterium]
MTQSSPDLAAVRPVIQEWLERYFTWDVMLPRYIALYTSLYSEDELLGLAEWLSSDLGQRYVELQPEYQQRAARMGADLAMEYQGELEAMIEAYLTGASQSERVDPKKGSR